MYSVSGYGDMISDRVRMDAYINALHEVINPDSVVADIGCGTGIFSLLACQFGARKVYAIEPDMAIQVARESAKVSGYLDRIEFFPELSTRVKLPEQADVIISDLRGVLPLYQHHIPSIIDARERLLVPNGVMIPAKDTLWIAPVEDENLYLKYTAPWDNNNHGLNMQAARKIVTNTWGKARITGERLLSKPQCWGELDYISIESPDILAEINWTADRAGVFHGLCAWFDTILIGESGFSNAPDKSELIYGQAFFPLSNPVSLAQGDTTKCSLRARLTNDDYIWNWNTVVFEQGDVGQEKASFKQSTFFGQPLSIEQLRKQASNYRPAVNLEGQVTQRALTSMNSKTSLDEIAHDLVEQFPDHFLSHRDALAYAGELSQKYSR